MGLKVVQVTPDQVDAETKVVSSQTSGAPCFFQALLERCAILEVISGKIVNPDEQFKIVRNLSGYLSELRVQCAVIEEDYVDRDYLDDYGRYYSRCDAEYKRRCCRIHFFSKTYEEKDIINVVSKSDGKERAGEFADFAETYLGFVVIRPLSTAIVGRTCLKPYPQEDAEQKDTGRRYRALTDVRVSFFGRELVVRCMPFLQQDSTTAACASCALWSAFMVTAQLFRHKLYCPGCITALATEHGMYEGLSFPNGGLWNRDLTYATRAVGLEPLWLGGDMGYEEVDLSPNPHELFGYIYAYSNVGLPIILTGFMVDGKGCRGGHAVTINGYHLGDGSGREGRFVSDRIDKIYVHDDQVGPGARVTLDRATGKWISDWVDFDSPRDSKGRFCKMEMRNLALMIPVYPKMRVCYDMVVGQVEKMKQAVDMVAHPENIPDGEMKKGLLDLHDQLRKWGVNIDEQRSLCDQLEWDIRLQTCDAFKTWIRNDSDMAASGKQMDYLAKSYPKYVWDIGLLINGKPEMRFVVDATDSGLGLRVLDVIRSMRQIRPIWWIIMNVPDSDFRDIPMLMELKKSIT